MTTKIIRVKISRQDCRTRQIAGVRKKKAILMLVRQVTFGRVSEVRQVQVTTVQI